MEFKKKVLENGLRIIAVPIKGAPSVSVMSLVEAGSKYEAKDKNGISHFLEHMCFKGTEKRPHSIDIAKEFDEIGSEHNAFTVYEYTCYFAKAHDKHLDKLIDITADMYLNPTYDKQEIEKEKGVIVEEINMYEDMPDRMAHEVFHALLYGDQPAGWDIAGPRENVRSFTRDDFINYRNNHYLAAATAIVVAGDIEPHDVFSKIEKAFSQIRTGKKADKDKIIENQTRPELKLKFKETDQTHMVLGVRAFDAYDKRGAVLSILSTVLGRGMSSRLFQKMRNELGICYYIGSGTEKFTDHGYLAVFAGVDKSRVGEGVQGILDEMKRIRDEKVSPEELRKAKDYYIGHLYLGLESSDAAGLFFGMREILKQDLKTPEEVEKEVEKVRAEDVQKVAEEIMQNNRLNLAIVGKYTDEEIENLRAKLVL